MGLKLLVMLLIIGIQVSDGGKILKKLTKELKKVIDGAKFEDFIALLSDDVSENSDKIHLVADNVTNVAVHLANNVADIANVKVDVANNSDHIDHNYVKIHLIADHVDNATRCTAINWDFTCCTSANPCGIGQGDCDSDDGCYGDLKCGTNNCVGFGHSSADCCMLVGIHDNALNIANINVDVANNDAAIADIKVDVANNSDHIDHNYVKIHLIADHVDNATRCTAINWDYTCCTSANPCGIGQGDCDSDAECYGDLKCGSNNCIGFVGDSGADCCMLVGIHDNALNIANNKVDIANIKVDVANNVAAISSIDSAIVSLSEDVANNILNITNLKVDVANHWASHLSTHDAELENGGKDCYHECKQGGKCNWCGADGWCCRKDWVENGCDGTIGGPSNHQCTLNNLKIKRCPTEISTSTTWFREVTGKCYYIMIKGCPDGNGCTLQEAQTVCGSVFGSDTIGIVFEPTTLAINDAVLQAAKDAVGTGYSYWIGVNNGDLTYHSNGNPVSLASIPWNSGHPNSARDCVGGNSGNNKWYSNYCHSSTMYTICEMTY